MKANLRTLVGTVAAYELVACPLGMLSDLAAPLTYPIICGRGVKAATDLIPVEEDLRPAVSSLAVAVGAVLGVASIPFAPINFCLRPISTAITGIAVWCLATKSTPNTVINQAAVESAALGAAIRAIKDLK
jgi:hypothetical protein